MKHSIISPSNSSRWLSCPASVRAIGSLDIIEDISAPAAFGTLTHSLAESMLKNDKALLTNENFYKDADALTIEEQQLMRNYASAYTSEVQNLQNFVNPDKFLIEHYTFLFKVGEHEIGGTCDAVMIKADHAYIIDLKTGRIPVSAVDNTQLKLYAAGVMLENPNLKNFTLKIIQPSIKDSDSSFTISKNELFQFYKFALTQALSCFDTNAEFKASSVACEYCQFRVKCKAHNEYIYKLLSNSDKKLEETTISDLTRLFDNSKHIKKYLIAVEDFLLAEFQKEDNAELLQSYDLKRSLKREILIENKRNKMLDILKASAYDTDKLKKVSELKKLLLEQEQDPSEFFERPEGDLKLNRKTEV